MAKKHNKAHIPASPVAVDNQVPLSINQLDDVYSIVHEMIENLDEAAISELSGGQNLSIDQIIDTLIDETAAVVASKHSTLQTGSFGYLEKFTDEVEETLRCKSLNYFIISVLPEFILGWHNIEWSNLIQINRLLCVLAARDHGKSYHFSFAYPLWQMYRYKRKGTHLNPTPKEFQMAREGLLITNEFGLARHFLAMIKEEIGANDILRNRLMPDSKREGWGAEKIVCKNGASLAIKSAGSKIRGYHPTYIVLDDFLNESSLYSQDQRDKYWNTFSAVILPALSPGGQMLIVGTPFFEKDLYAQLKDTGKYRVFEYPAIFPNGKLLFPQRHTFDSLMEKKQILGSLIFSREILVKPISDSASIFPYDSLRNAIKGQDSVDVTPNIDSSARRFAKIVVGCDFAISSNIGADFSVFTILGVDELGIFHVLNCWRKAGSNYGQQIAALKKINNDFRPDVMYAEDNGMQQIFIQMMEDANLPVVGKTTNAINKKSLYKGIPSLAVLFETGRIKFPYGTQRAKNLTDLYFGELNSITYIQDTGKLESVSQHDDCGMSLWNAVNAAKGDLEEFDFSFI
jgi:hypothetical protein